jgi:hypothetical protein
MNETAHKIAFMIALGRNNMTITSILVQILSVSIPHGEITAAD